MNNRRSPFSLWTLACCLLVWTLHCLLPASSSAAGGRTSHLDFVTIRLGASDRVVLVVGGIQGDEPGGFSAATLLATRYQIQRGALWIVPNLNFPSIIERSRGLHGDMNRKFARLDDKDPEFSTVRRIQEIISNPQVVLVLNLHDGSGYYHDTNISHLRNPKRWGQSVVIDQESIAPTIFLHALGDTARNVISTVNSKLLAPEHALHLHDTRTAEGDKEMEKSLSYYAIRQNKAAFGLEASKEFPVEVRTYYHLQMVESFLALAGVTFSRDFELSPAGVAAALRANLGVSFADNRVFLPLEDVRPAVRFLPLPKDSPGKAVTSKPIMAVLPCKGHAGQICIHYGNRTITLITPEWREMDDSVSSVRVMADKQERQIAFGQVLTVKESVRVLPQKGYRLNAIGFGSGLADESGADIRLKDFTPRFSVDRGGRLFRMEIYRGQDFCGMFLVRFAQGGMPPKNTAQGFLPDRKGPESAKGN